MTTINLHQNQEDVQKKMSAKTANGGFIFSLAILFLTIGSLYATRFYKGMIITENEELSNKVASDNQNLAKINSLQKVVDMQSRLALIKENLGIEKGKVEVLKMTEILDALERDMTSGVVIKSYEFDNENKEVNVSFLALNYNDAAKQLFAFKQSKYFTGASLETITREESGIVSEVKMSLAKK